MYAMGRMFQGMYINRFAACHKNASPNWRSNPMIVTMKKISLVM